MNITVFCYICGTSSEVDFLVSMEPMSQRSWREYLILVLSVLLVLILCDYLIAAQLFSQKTANKIFYKTGEIWRGFYFLIFGITCFYHAKSISLEGTNRKIHLENAKKLTLFIVSFICISILLFISAFPAVIIRFVYPSLFITANCTVGVLVLSYVEPLRINIEGKKLGVENEPSKKPLAIVFNVTGGYINISNPFRSSLVIGGAGAGKSKSIIEPMTFDAVKKRYAILMYDFKFPTLGNYLYSCLDYHKASNISFYSIAFTDVSRSHRFNPIEPRLLYTSTYAEEYSWTLYSNLDKEGGKKGGFFPESASSMLKAVMWFMKKKHPEYCTLPHIVNLILTAKTDILVKMLCSDDETAGMCKPVKEAADRKEAGAQLAGVVGSLTMQLGKINTPEICWVLTGDDFDLQLNNPLTPKALVLGNSPQVEQALSPVLAFICNIALKLMNDQKKNHSLVILDEAPTLTIPNIEKIPATARSNKLGLVYSAQDFSQMDKYLGPESRKAIVSNLASQFYGQISSFETAEYASKLLGKQYIQVKSESTGTSNSESGDNQSKNTSYSEQHRDIITPQEFISLPTGTFVGKLVESSIDWFKASFTMIEKQYPDFHETEIPVFVKDFVFNENDWKDIDVKTDWIINSPQNLFIDKAYSDLIIMAENKWGEEYFLHKEFRGMLYNVVCEEYRKEKTLQILNENFDRIIQEVKDLATTYEFEDAAKQFDKIVNQ